MTILIYTKPTNLDGSFVAPGSVPLTWDPSTLLDVEALLHFNADSAGSYLDSTGNHTWTGAPAGANVIQPPISTSQKKFGAGSIDLDPTDAGWASGRPRTQVQSEVSSAFNPATDKWTAETWVYLRTSPLGGFPAPVIFSIGNAGGGFSQVTVSIGFYLGSDPQEFRMDSSDGNPGGTFAATTNIVIADQTWTHVALSHDSGELQLFVDGVLGAIMTPGAHMPNLSSKIVMGYTTNSDLGGDGSRWRGYMDELIYTRGRTKYWDDDFTPASTELADEPSMYAIYRDGVLIGTSATLDFTDDDVTPLATYQYQVAAYDGSDDISERSDIFEITIPGLRQLRIFGFNDELVPVGYLGGRLQGTTVACPGDNANEAKPCC